MRSPLKYPLKWQLSLSYVLMALVLVAAVSLFSNLLLHKQFKAYIIRQQDSKNKAVAAQIAQEYDAGTQGYAPGVLETIGMNALERGMILRVSDASGNVLWDAMVHNNGLCQLMLRSMAEDMINRYPDFEGAYEEKYYPLTAEMTGLTGLAGLTGSAVIGSVTIGYYGPFYYTDSDVAFLDTFNRALVAIGLISLVLAVFVGLYIAGHISRPIARAIDSTERIARGNYTEKIAMRSGTLELDRLIASVNSLSSALHQQDLLRKRLTADVAHELRTPLATLQGNFEALMDGIWQPDPERLESLYEEILRLSRLVDDLEKLSGLESEGAALQRTDVDIRKLAEETILHFSRQLAEKNIHATVTGETAVIPADRDKLRQVFINLVSNSIKYTPDEGRIMIRIAGEGAMTIIRVEDTGIGISEEDLPYIFERFYRADHSRSSRSGGAGIGLAIVREIVAMHDGTVIAESEAGKGTIVTIRLPKSAAP